MGCACGITKRTQTTATAAKTRSIPTIQRHLCERRRGRTGKMRPREISPGDEEAAAKSINYAENLQNEIRSFLQRRLSRPLGSRGGVLYWEMMWAIIAAQVSLRSICSLLGV